MKTTATVVVTKHPSKRRGRPSSTENVVELSTVAAYEQMLGWRQQYLDWLATNSLQGPFLVKLNQIGSRSWSLIVKFSDRRDAVWFKLVWGGTQYHGERKNTN